jgi:hypothetical protein
MGERLGSALEFDQAVKALGEHIEVLKQELLFAIAEERRTESTTQSNIIKR